MKKCGLRRKGKDVDAGILENYIEKIYSYALKRSFSEEEADELSQEILFTAVRKLPKLRDKSRFEPWLWGIAANVSKVFRRNKGKERILFSYDVLDNFPYEDVEAEENEELYATLRSKIARLSAAYRDIIILHYYDGLSVKQIAQKLNIPEGTVTWRLSEARSKLKKEYTTMEESALRPIKMYLSIYGSGYYNGEDIPFPASYIDDSVSHNILYYCYEEPKTIEELSKLTGIPAFYIEERMDNLKRRAAVIEQPKGRYQTDFVIYFDKHCAYYDERAELVLLPIMERMITAFKSISKEACEISFYKAEKDERELFYLYGVLAMEHAYHKYYRHEYPEIPPNYDGYRWRYIADMQTPGHRSTRIGYQISRNDKSSSANPYIHRVYFIKGFVPRHAMYTNMYNINICEELLHYGDTGSTQDTYQAAKLIRDGYLRKNTEGTLFLTIPAFTGEQKRDLDEVIERHLHPLMSDYSCLVERFIAGYRKLFPRHLRDDVDRIYQRLFFELYDAILSYGQRNGTIEPPRPDSVCDVLIQDTQ